MDWLKLRAVLFASKRFIIPAILGSLVLWLIANGLEPWANVVCAFSDAIGISIEECK
jgi:hypothetical protein